MSNAQRGSASSSQMFVMSQPDFLAVLPTVFDGAPNAILVAEDDGTIVFANAAAGAIFDYPADQLVRQSIARLAWPWATAVPERRLVPSWALSGALESVAGHDVDGLRRNGVIVSLEL